jgi:hypothetical protein
MLGIFHLLVFAILGLAGAASGATLLWAMNIHESPFISNAVEMPGSAVFIGLGTRPLFVHFGLLPLLMPKCPTDSCRRRDYHCIMSDCQLEGLCCVNCGQRMFFRSNSRSYVVNISNEIVGEFALSIPRFVRRWRLLNVDTERRKAL